MSFPSRQKAPSMRTIRCVLVSGAALALLLSACGGGGGGDDHASASVAETPVNSKLTAQLLNEPKGEHCAEGGKALSVGTDTNADGVPDTDVAVSYFCNGERTLSWVDAPASTTADANMGYIASSDTAPVELKLPAEL